MRRLSSYLPGRAKLAFLSHHLKSQLPPMVRPREIVIVPWRASKQGLLVSLGKSGRTLKLGVDLSGLLERRFVYRMLYARLPVVLHIFQKTSPAVSNIVADVSDGNEGAIVAFCSSRDDAVLIPDPVFYNTGAYSEFRHSQSILPWRERSNIVVWRGTSTGFGLVSSDTMEASDNRLRQRVRMCLILRSVPGTDVKMRKVESDASATDKERLALQGLLGGKIAQHNFGRYKFALDVDGHTNAWSNFFVRLLLGCCVIKIGSEGNYRQWYYGDLRPWQHYVPVRPDMSDLIEKIEWCQSHDAECREIAEAGQRFALSLDLDTEIARAARRIDEALGSDASSLSPHSSCKQAS